MSADFYAVLNLLPSATLEDIKRRYYELAKLHHPDKGSVTTEFVAIQQAWETLKDVESRKKYDAQYARLQHLEGVSRVAGEIDLDDMEYDEGRALFRTPCRCGSVYEITENQLSESVELVYCSGCTLQIRVLTNWYRERQEKERAELDKLETEYQKRVKDLEEMDDNRKNRVADKVRQQQTQASTTPTRQRSTTSSAVATPGRSWSSVVKNGTPPPASSSNAAPPSEPSKVDAPQSPQRAKRTDARAPTSHKRQTSNSSTGESSRHSRGASPSRSSIQAGTVRKMQGSFTPPTTNGTADTINTRTSTRLPPGESRARISARSATSATLKVGSLAPYSPTSAPYSPSNNVPVTSSGRTRIMRSPSTISPTISAIASNFSGPVTAPPTSPSSPSIQRSTSTRNTTTAVTTKPSYAQASSRAIQSPSRPSATSPTPARSASPALSSTTTPSPTTLATPSKRTASAVSPTQTRMRSASSISTVSSSTRTSTTTSKATPTTITTTASSKKTSATPPGTTSRASGSTSPSTQPHTSKTTSANVGVIRTPTKVTSPPVARQASPASSRAPTAATPTATPDSPTGSKKSTPSTPRMPIPARLQLDPTLLRGTRLEMRGNRLIHAHGDQVLNWNVSTYECETHFTAHSDIVHNLALRSNSTIVSASNQETLLWDATNGKVLGNSEGCTAMAAHAYYEQVAVAREDGKIALLHLPTFTQLSLIDTGVKGVIQALAWVSETHLLFAVDTRIRLLDTSKSVVEKSFDGHTGKVLHIETFSNSSEPIAPGNVAAATHFFTLCDQNDVFCWQISTSKVVSKTVARGSCSTLFVLDDRNNKSLTHRLLPILVDPEGITVIAANEDSVKMEEPEQGSHIAHLAASTPVLLI